MGPAGGVAIVTGAASGIGAAVARMLDANGFRVLGCDVNAERLHDLAVATSNAAVCEVDITDAAGVAEVVGRAADLGPLVAVANVAGVNDGCAAAHEITDANWD